MIAELGLALLWMAAALACLSLISGTLYLRGGPKDGRARAAGECRARRADGRVAFALLIGLFLRTDMSVELVARNSNSMKPMALQIRGRLGQSRRLDAAVGDGAGVAGRRWSRCSSGGCAERTLVATLAAQAAIALGFFAFLLFASNPFERLDPAPIEGRGSTRCCRTRAWPSIRRRFISAMSACRSRSPSRSAR